jgi:hypothetical protein
MAEAADSYPCPCCGSLVFEEPPGSYEICDVCGWEDDISQLRWPLAGGGANDESLYEAQQAFIATGTAPQNRERGWRPFDPKKDIIEPHGGGIDYGLTYPTPSTRLYYWRDSFWLPIKP